MATKTYVLTESLDSNAPIYQTTADKQRSQVKKKPVWRPYLRIQFQDKNGVSRVIRYKSNAVNGDGKVVLDQRRQMEELKMEANETFTTSERRDLEFRHGILVTNKIVSQEYLEAYPGFEGFDGTCDEIRQPQFKLLDQAAEAKIKNTEIRKRVKAANKVVDLTLADAKALLIRINGSYFETPNTGDEEADLAECINMLMNFVDDTNEAGLDDILKDTTNIDEDTRVLIGSLINAEILSFDHEAGAVSKKLVDGSWATVREISETYSAEERMRLFTEFLNTTDGKPLKTDLENSLNELDDSGEGKEKGKRGRPKTVK